ncbi:MAG: VWA domain-containing protein, partial [Kofleriaceae bacterium]|nr:VWA domain-containing protein [Kofleriaceae bacterium]
MATSARKILRDLVRPRNLVWILLTCAAAVGIYLAVSSWIDGRPTVPVDVTDRPITLLDPDKLLLIAIVPFFYLLRRLSLTDLSVLQQSLQATLRSLVVVALAIAAARPSRITDTSKVSTIVLVDVSDSISDKQLDAARAYVDDIQKSLGDGNLQLVTFAEKPQVARPADGKKLSSGIERHKGAGAGTDTQSAMQLAYGLYPDGYVPRMVIVSDGNQTQGDLAVEAYRAKELGVRVSWRTFEADKTAEVRVVGVTVPDDIKVGQPFEVTAEVWSTEAQTATLV